MTNIGAPQAYGLHDFANLSLTSRDGTHVLAWYHTAQAGYPTIIYFHGNGGHLGHRANYFRLLSEAGFGVLGLDYRGYGTSEGSPSEEGFYQDARAVMDYATGTASLTPNQLIIYGESIGTGVAVQMASEYASAALVLQSPFTSLETVAQGTYPWLPVHLLLRDRFDSLSKIGAINVPLLFFHGEQDTIVPIALGKMLFAQASDPKESIYYPDKGHHNLDTHLLTNTLIEFCNRHKFIHAAP